MDASNAIDTTYAGTVHFTASDGQAVLPANSTLTNGVGTFSATLKTAGNQTLTAADTVTGSITGTSNPITVSAAAATHFAVSAPASASTGVAFSFTVTALDQFNNTATGYAGVVHFTSSDVAAILPANSTLTNGAGTFSATLNSVGGQTINGTDTTTSSITGTSNTIVVSGSSIADLTITKTAPATIVAGNNLSYVITVSNGGPNPAANVLLTDTLPAAATFVSLSAPGGWTTTTPTAGSTGIVTAAIPTLANGAVASFTLTVQVVGGTAAGTVITNTASVSSAATDSTPANNASTAATTVSAAIASLSPIPTLSDWGVMALSAILARFGLWQIRRRREY